MGYITLAGLGRELPQDYYPEAMAVASSLADTIKWASAILTEEERVNQSIKWDGVSAWSGQELYNDPGILTRNAVDAITKVAAGTSNLDDAYKALAEKAFKDNGILPTEKGSTPKSTSAYWDRDAMEYVKGNANKLLEKWKWFEFAHSTPSNAFDDFSKWVGSGLPEVHIPKIDNIDDALDYAKWGALAIIGILLLKK